MAWPFSSGSRLTSPMMAPPLARIGSTSIGPVWSNTSHTVSARRNMAAGAGAAKENITRRPSLSRLASTEAAAGSAFFGASTTAAVGFFGATGFDVSSAAAGFACEGVAAFGVSAEMIFSSAGVRDTTGGIFSAAGAISAA